jgi:transcriptional accessory protein Tex/SPT6
MFVDIGTKKDGLVHIKDVSRDYFLNDLTGKFSPGQDVDVWVKFIEEKDSKLGLQMFAPRALAQSLTSGLDSTSLRSPFSLLVKRFNLTIVNTVDCQLLI